MTKKESKILTKAVSIAKRNGFNIEDDFFTSIATENKLLEGKNECYKIIFDHEFAKCFWGETAVEINHPDDIESLDPTEVSLSETAEQGLLLIAGLVSCNQSIKVPMWEYHLAQMMFRNKPIDYIGEFLETTD